MLEFHAVSIYYKDYKCLLSISLFLNSNKFIGCNYSTGHILISIDTNVINICRLKKMFQEL